MNTEVAKRREQNLRMRAHSELNPHVSTWVFYNDPSAKRELMRVWAELPDAAREALANEVRELVPGKIVVYRTLREADSVDALGGSSVTDSRQSRGNGNVHAFEIRPDDILLHYGMSESWLSSKAYAHEREIILRPDARPVHLDERASHAAAQTVRGASAGSGKIGAYREVVDRTAFHRRVSDEWWPSIEDAARLLQRAPYELNVGYGNPSALGCGHFGCVFELPEYPGKVLKITGDPSDAAAAQAVLNVGGDLPNVVRVYGVFVFPRAKHPGYLFGLVLERLSPVADRESMGIEDIIEPMSWQKLSPRELVERMRVGGDDELLPRPAKPERAAHMAEVLDGLDALRAIGVVLHDVRHDNVMVDADGKWKLSDLGVNEASEVEVPELHEFDLLGALKGNGRKGSHVAARTSGAGATAPKVTIRRGRGWDAWDFIDVVFPESAGGLTWHWYTPRGGTVGRVSYQLMNVTRPDGREADGAEPELKAERAKALRIARKADNDEYDGEVETVTKHAKARVKSGAPVFTWEPRKIHEVQVGDSRVVYSVVEPNLDDPRRSVEAHVHLSSLRTPAKARGSGSGRRAMETFLAAVDAELGLPVTLGASPLDTRTKLGRLVQFYQSLGFVLTGRSINPVGHPEMMRKASVALGHARAAKGAAGLPPESERRQRIRDAAKRGEWGKGWYQRAEEEIRTVARAWGVDPIYVAVAVAATSPATPVIQGPRMARGGGRGSNIAKARRVVKTQALTGKGSTALHRATPGMSLLRTFETCTATGASPVACLTVTFPKPGRVKTHAFVRNLLGYGDPVTVDTLVGREVAGRSIDVTEARHEAIAADIRAVALELGWQPREVMAAVWTAAGGSGDLNLATTAERQLGRSGS